MTSTYEIYTKKEGKDDVVIPYLLLAYTGALLELLPK